MAIIRINGNLTIGRMTLPPESAVEIAPGASVSFTGEMHAPNNAFTYGPNTPAFRIANSSEEVIRIESHHGPIAISRDGFHLIEENSSFTLVTTALTNDVILAGEHDATNNLWD